MAFELANVRERPSSPSLRELTEGVQKKIDLYRSSKDDSSHSPTMAAVPEPPHYTSRDLSDPIAAVEICPAYPDYMIVGTYALLKRGEPEASVGQIRNGSISVVPLATGFKPAYPGQVAPFLDEKCLNAAVLDIHFHPSDDTLFGVATSDAKVAFFRLRKRADILARRVEMHLLHLGSIEVSRPDKHGEIPLITSFCWMPGFLTKARTGRPDVDDFYTVSLTASISNGDVKWIRAMIPAASSSKEDRLSTDTNLLASATLERHTEEAWTVAATTISATNDNTGDVQKILILSGGDDSALNATSATLISRVDQVASAGTPNKALSAQENVYSPDSAIYTPSLLTFTPQHLWTDRKTHTAGVVAILPLPPPPGASETPTTIPILTGSYDEHIRLFLLGTTSPTLKRSLLLEKKLGGGVWRLKLMHSSTSRTKDDTTLILASCMHGGVRILRLTYTPTTTSASPASDASSWHLTVLAKFTKGHESMNYGSDFRAERDEDGKRTDEYTVVSTSFYDKAVCVWKFVDCG